MVVAFPMLKIYGATAPGAVWVASCRQNSTAFLASCQLACHMAPHLTPAELDFIHAQAASGKQPIDVHRALANRRARRGVSAPTLSRFRKGGLDGGVGEFLGCS